MTFIKNFISFIFIFISFNLKANIHIPQETINLINNNISQKGFVIKENSIVKNNNNYILMLKRNHKKNIFTHYQRAILSFDHDTLFLVNETINLKSNNDSNFKKMKNTLRILKSRSEQGKNFRFSTPIAGEKYIDALNANLLFSTNHSFLIFKNSNKVHIGSLIYLNEGNFKDYTKERILKKKSKEVNTVNILKEEYPQLVLGDINNKIVVMFYSIDCSFCKLMIKNYKLYDDLGYSFLILPATQLNYDLKFEKETFRFFCDKQTNKTIINDLPDCYNPQNNEILQNIYTYKRKLLGGIQFVGTPFLYLTDYSLWYSGMLKPEQLKSLYH